MKAALKARPDHRADAEAEPALVLVADAGAQRAEQSRCATEAERRDALGVARFAMAQAQRGEALNVRRSEIADAVGRRE